MKDTIIIDLDGTLCNDGHRDSFAKIGEWDDYHSRCSDDTVFEDVRAFLSFLRKEDLWVVAITGRNEKYRPATNAWLLRNGAMELIDEVMMRPDDNYEKAGELKISLMEQWFRETRNMHAKADILDHVAFAIDDTEKVVEAFRNYGIACWQVREGH